MSKDKFNNLINVRQLNEIIPKLRNQVEKSKENDNVF